jgi:hypothetical protein
MDTPNAFWTIVGILYGPTLGFVVIYTAVQFSNIRKELRKISSKLDRHIGDTNIHSR